MAADDRAERLARNEATFRDVNERIVDLTKEQREQLFDALCECSDATCTERIELTLAEYARVRSRGEQFAVVPGHEVPEIERVVEQTDRFAIVEKVGEGARVARELDPRSPS